MRIAMFTNNYKPYIGGVQISIQNLASSMRKLGHTVYIFAPTYPNQEEEEYVIRYPSLPFSISGAPVPNILTTLFEKKVVELGIDIIHVHHPALVGNIALHLKKKYDIPVVFTYHTRYEEYMHYIKGLMTLESVFGGIERYLVSFCNKCDLIVAPTDEIKNYIEDKDINDTHVTVIPTGITYKAFDMDFEERYKIVRKYKKNADYLFVTVSRLAKEKNLRFQIEGLCKLKETLSKEGKTFRYMIIGDGPYRQELERLIHKAGLSEEISLLGSIDNDKLANYYAAANAFLFSSKSETQGIVILEAMAQAKPVIAVNATGVCDIVRNGVNGYLTSEEPEEWAESVVKAVSDVHNYRGLSSEARNTALCYLEDNIAKKFEKRYMNLCALSSHYDRITPRKIFRSILRPGI